MALWLEVMGSPGKRAGAAGGFLQGRGSCLAARRRGRVPRWECSQGAGQALSRGRAPARAGLRWSRALAHRRCCDLGHPLPRFPGNTRGGNLTPRSRPLLGGWSGGKEGSGGSLAWRVLEGPRGPAACRIQLPPAVLGCAVV